MKKKYGSLLICLLTLIFLSQFFIHTKELQRAFYEGTGLWFYNLLPTIFPFFIISDILNNYHLVDYICLFLGNLFQKLFKLPKEASFAFFMSMFSGFPGNSKFIKELLDDQIITCNDATKLLTFTHFSNPLFIVSTIGINFLNNKRIGIIILISHFITNIIIGLLFRNIFRNTNNTLKRKERVTLSFIPLLKTSIMNTINTSLLIYGIIIFFFILTTIINLNINLSLFNKTILNGFVEMTNGLKLISELDYTIITKAVLSTFFISFGGFSVHLQSMSILANYRINYFIYLVSRLMHGGIASLIVYLILINY